MKEKRDIEVKLISSKENSPQVNQENSLLLCTSDEFRFTELNRIIYCESDNAYTTFFFNDGTKILISKSLKYYETLLGSFGFIRIHQSRVINIKNLRRIVKRETSYVVEMSDGTQLVIARQKRKHVINILKIISVEGGL